MAGLWQRSRKWIVDNVLGLEDSPHRIAFGVFLGTFIAFTPLFGFHTFIFLGVAALLGANVVSGIPTLYISNIFTAAPIYYGCWKLGAFVRQAIPPLAKATGNPNSQPPDIAQALKYFSEVNWIRAPFTSEFWIDTWRIFYKLGIELWIGGAIVGLALGVPLYFLTYWAVLKTRQRRKKRAKN